MQGVAFVVVGWLIATLRGALARATSLSRTDSLTSLLNRRAFYEVAAQVLALGRRYGHPVTLAYIDLDNFKTINDTQGHEAGDDTLRRAAELLQRSIRRGDVAARFGGDEFVVLLPETGPAGAAPLLERLRSGMAETLDQKHKPITVTIGAIAFTMAPTDVEDLVRRADAAMYAAKAAGKNRVGLSLAESTTQTNAVL
ncbi:MAG: GGDEF domain-containing protein [Vicinamibacterales bacterium]